jgi:hypothetical protein
MTLTEQDVFGPNLDRGRGARINTRPLTRGNPLPPQAKPDVSGSGFRGFYDDPVVHQEASRKP